MYFTALPSVASHTFPIFSPNLENISAIHKLDMSSQVDSVAQTPPSTSENGGAGSKKRKADVGAGHADTKRQKTKPAAKPKGKKTTKQAEAYAPKKKRINKSLRQKIDQILEFRSSSTAGLSRLDRDETQTHIIVKESALLGALMILRSDFELSDPRAATLLDVEDITVREFVAPTGTLEIPCKYIVLDISKHTTLETSIHQKTEGNGIDSIGLLENELEMYTTQLEEAAITNLLDAVGGSSPLSSPSPENAS